MPPTRRSKAPAKKAPAKKPIAQKTSAGKSPASKTPAKPPATKKTTKKVPARSAAASNGRAATSRPAPGSKAPAFTLKDQNGRKHSLKDYAGRPVVLFFYPKDMTSGCTKEACAFRDLLPNFDAAEAQVFGISIMDARSKKKFADKEGLTFPLLADDKLSADGAPEPEVARKYGVWTQKSMYGKTYMGIERATFLIGKDGKVARRWDNVKVPGHAEEVLEAAAALSKPA